MKKRCFMCIAVASLMFSLTSFAAQGWVQDAKGWKYEKNDGSYATSEWIEDNGNQYYVDFTGYMKASTWVAHKGEVYYVDSSGAMLRSTVTPDGKTVKADGTWDVSVPTVKQEIVSLNAIETIDERTAYIINSDTDSSSVINSADINDMKIVCALLGQKSVIRDSLNEKEKEIFDVVNTFIAQKILSDDTDYEKVVKITEFIWTRGTYAKKGIIDNHTPYGIFVLGEGVCESYARSFKILANAVGLDCWYVVGTNYGGAHAWNKVFIDGEWYVADVTEPVSGYGTDFAPYILQTDEAYSGVQGWAFNYPSCTATKWIGKNMDGYLSTKYKIQW